MIHLVAFLGNPGREYEMTRHNAARQFAEAVPFAAQLNWQSKFKGRYAAPEPERIAAGSGFGGENGTRRVHFLEPETFMNNSGESVAALASFYKIGPDEILVVHDELELPAGTVSLKWSGGLGGHNGLRSVKAALGTADFWRLRFGIGRPDGGDIADYVLSPFTPAEREILSRAFSGAAQLLLRLLSEKDPARLVPEWKKKNFVTES